MERIYHLIPGSHREAIAAIRQKQHVAVHLHPEDQILRKIFRKMYSQHGKREAARFHQIFEDVSTGRDRQILSGMDTISEVSRKLPTDGSTSNDIDL